MFFCGYYVLRIQKLTKQFSFIAPEEDFNESFGDFIGGPSVSTCSQSEPAQPAKEETSDIPITETNDNQSPRGSQKEETKGIFQKLIRG